MTSTYTNDQKAAQKAYLYKTCPNIITADEFAKVLGLDSSNSQRSAMEEVNKMNQINTYIGRNGQEPAEKQDPHWSQFCALYLPKTVEVFISLPEITSSPGVPESIVEDMRLHNAYLAILVAAQHVPYFFHFFRGNNDSGKQLPAVIVERLVSLAPKWDERMLHPKRDFSEPQYHETLADAIQLLGTLCTIHRKTMKEILPRSSGRTQLVPWLKKWGPRYRGTLLGTVCTRLLSIFSDPDFKIEVKGMRGFLKNWDSCAYPGCTKTDNLKACARCRTVRYCSPEHQKTHWKSADGSGGHKLVCFKTVY